MKKSEREKLQAHVDELRELADELEAMCEHDEGETVNDDDDDDDDDEDDVVHHSEPVAPTGPPMVPLAFPPTLLSEGETKTITVTAQLPFRGERLMVAHGAEVYSVEQLTLAGEDQLSDALPSEVFSPGAFGTRLSLPVVEAGRQISLRITRRPQQATFSAVLLGRVERVEEKA